VDDLRATSWGDRVRWVPEENLHLTLRFLGEVSEDRLDGIVERVRAFASSCTPFACRLAALRPFPSEGRVRVIAASVAPEPPLSELQERVERGVVAAGFDDEPRRFRAHITLGRVRKPPLRDAAFEAMLSPAPIEVERVVLYASRLSSSGAHYTPLVEIPLSGEV